MPPNNPTAGTCTASSVTLECGTSLSERAHLDQIAPDASHRDSSREAPAPAAASSAAIANAPIRSARTVEELRDAVASDAGASAAGPAMFWSPLEVSQGRKAPLPMVYCDQTASNRPLRSIERYLQDVCLPYYGNTHTNTSITGSQSTAFCAEARQLVAEAVNAKTTGKASQDVVLFAGNGTTSAVELLLDCLGFHHAATSSTKPVVFIGPFEHHSNLLPWRESGAKIVMVPERDGHIDMAALERLLEQHRSDDAVKIGAFTAASNVTGAVVDTNAVTAMLHQHGCLAIWDYATGAPYLNMNMNPMDDTRYAGNPAVMAKDAIFFSPHKMIGGVNTPGVLIIKKRLVQQVNPPRRSGGGTVFYVTQEHHRFLSNRIERYEGGTPNVVGIWRVGLAMLFKRQIENKHVQLAQSSTTDNAQSNKNVSDEYRLPPTILDYEYQTYDRVSKALRQIPNVVLLGDSTNADRTRVRRLPIFSFLIKCGQRFLHYNYVCAVLNDVFGIQSRGGCQCAGPYSQRLLGLTDIDTATGTESPSHINEQIETALVHAKERAELLRPGFTRLSLPFKGVSTSQVEYVVSAIRWVAENGWVLLPSYRCNHRTGEWRHKQRQGAPLGKRERLWLSHYSFSSAPAPAADTSASWDDVLRQTMQTANVLLELARNDAPGIQQALKMTDEAKMGGGEADAALEELRWYVYPKEVASFVAQGVAQVPGTMERDNLLGALRPLAWYPKATVAIPIETETIATTPRQPVSNQIAPAASLVSFRDGEHSGEASRDEIEAGFDDGELSEDCVVYSCDGDRWVPIQEFLGLAKTEAATAAGATINDVEANPEPLRDVDETAHVALSDVNLLKSTLALPVDEKNQKKKPPRDSNEWGQGKYVPIKAPDVTPMTTSISRDAIAEPEAAKRKKGTKHEKPPPKMMRLVTQATVQWDMLQDGDRLLLGLSGGKDSLSLLHILMEFQRKLPIKFEIEVCTIDPMTPSFDPSPLIPYVESLGLKYHYIRDDIVDRANSAGENGQMVSSLCAFCARMKRGLLYATARKNNCNKLVLAQHLDDLAESFMMSVMHNGFLRTMKAHYQINAGDLAVIRPLAYCRESLTTEFAKSANLPIINENCPACFEEPKERARIKKLLQREESMYPNFYDNIKRSLLPLMHDDATAILRAYTEEAVAKSRKVKNGKKRPRVQKDGDLKKSKQVSPFMADPMTIKETKSDVALSDVTDDELVRELARRRAEKFRLSGANSANKRLVANNDPTVIPDPTGMVCSLNGGNGTIPCRELME